MRSAAGRAAPPRWAALLTALGLALAPSQARSAPRPLRADLATDGAIAGVLAAGWFGSELFKGRLAPASCRWCGSVPAVDRAVRDAALWQDATTADFWSNVTAFGLAPVAAIGLTAAGACADGATRDALVDAVVIAEATAAAAAINQITKFAVGRERPFVHALQDSAKGLTVRPADNNLSFYSGHTNLTFALAVSSGTVATLRGYRHAGAVWATGLSLAAATGWLRIAADKHYFSDVLTGAAIGSAVGFAVPYLFHRPVTAAPTVAVEIGRAEGGLTLGWRW